MKNNFFTEIRVGVFVFVCLLLGMVTLFQISSQHRIFRLQYTLYANFENISGLRTGASVQLGGMDVGFVENIEFPQDLNTRKIRVALRISSSFQDRIRADSKASINTMGLLGDKFVFISVGSNNEPVLKEGNDIPSAEITSIAFLTDKAGKIMDDISKAAEGVKNIVGEDDKGDNLKAAVESLSRSLKQIEKGKGFFHSLVYDPKGAAIVSDLADTMKTVKGDFRDILGAIKRGDGTIGMLIRDPALYNDLRTLLGRANRSAVIKSVVRATLKEGEK